MVRNKNIALSRLQIESNAWGLDFEGESNIIDVYIRYLRKKIDDDFDGKTHSDSSWNRIYVN